MHFRLFRKLALPASLLLHLLAGFWWLNRPAETPAVTGMPQTISISLIAPPAPVLAQPPPAPEPVPARVTAANQTPVARRQPPSPASAAGASMALTTAASTREPVTAPVTASQATAPPPATTARYDADYLDNPAPRYPPLSRRQGEEGTVLLAVHVASDGKPLAIEVKRSSGFGRLDTAARIAAAAWHFVPARQGDAVLASWVEVPVQFSLQK